MMSISDPQRRAARRFVFVLLPMFAVLSLMIATAAAQEDVLPVEFSGDLAFQHVADHVNIGFRQVATLGSYQAGNLILDKLESYGWETSEDWHVVNLGPTASYDAEALQTLEDWQPLTVQDLLSESVEVLAADQPDWRGVEVGELLVPVRNLVADDVSRRFRLLRAAGADHAAV